MYGADTLTLNPYLDLAALNLPQHRAAGGGRLCEDDVHLRLVLPLPQPRSGLLPGLALLKQCQMQWV